MHLLIHYTNSLALFTARYLYYFRSVTRRTYLHKTTSITN